MKFSKFIIVLFALFTITFTGAVLYVFLKTGSEPSTLVTMVFTVVIAEFWAMAHIKRGDLKRDMVEIATNNEQNDERGEI